MSTEAADINLPEVQHPAILSIESAEENIRRAHGEGGLSPAEERLIDAMLDLCAAFRQNFKP